MLVKGFAWWRRRPALMTFGLVPAAIVGLLLLGGLVTLALFLPSISVVLTPYAGEWPDFWRSAVQVLFLTAIFGAAVFIAVVTFTALTLVVGEPFYDRIWKQVERDLGGTVPDARYGFWRGVVDGLSLIVRGVGVALLAALVALVPVVGSIAAPVIGLLLTGWLLADELSSRALSARGLPRDVRRRMLRKQRARTLGFGVATQLCFLNPLGAILVMPAAVAGSTLLARSFEPASARA